MQAQILLAVALCASVVYAKVYFEEDFSGGKCFFMPGVTGHAYVNALFRGYFRRK